MPLIKLGATGILPVPAVWRVELELLTPSQLWRGFSVCHGDLAHAVLDLGIISGEEIGRQAVNRGQAGIELWRLRDVIPDARPEPSLGILA